MRFVDFPAPFGGGARQCSVLGFGCSALLGRVGRRESLAALGAAADAGINFFDTARSYGYGESEALLGEFLGSRRQDVVLSTKFGILPAAKGGLKQRIKPLAQAAIRLVPALRSVARAAASGSVTPGQFSVEVLRESFHASLRELRTDYVDILLLHAAPASVLQQQDLLEAMGRLVDEGKVRMAGISGEMDAIEATFAARPAAPTAVAMTTVLTTAQFAVNRTNLAFTRQTQAAAASGMFLVANHPFGGPAGVSATIARIAELAQDPNLPASLRAKLADKSVPADRLMPEVVLNCILSGTGIAAVVPAMMRPASLRSNVAAVGQCRFAAEEIATLREALVRRPEPGTA